MSAINISLRDLLEDPELFGNQFGEPSWDAWRALLCGFYGETLTDTEVETFRALTKRQEPPAQAMPELWMVIGRRGGKSQTAALLAIYECLFRDHSSRLSPGERARVMVIATDMKQARAVFGYCSGLVHSNPMLEAMIEREDRMSIEFVNQTTLEIAAATFRGLRGYTLAAAILDEVAFWRSEESVNPDREIIAALRPALATLDGRLIAISSPYSKRGELYQHYRRYFGSEDPSILVAQASSQTMNPRLPDHVIAEAKERDLPSALAEYEAQFRSDVESFVDGELLHGLTRTEPAILPPSLKRDGVRFAEVYAAFVDPSGGGRDGFALAIGHRETRTGRMVVDLVTEHIRSAPAEVVKLYAEILKRYGIREVVGDRYAGQWVAQEFERYGIRYEFTTKNRTELYTDFLAMVNSGMVELPPTTNDKLITQFVQLERRTTRGSRDVIDHPVGCHDDLANAVAGLTATAAGQRRQCLVGLIRGTSTYDGPSRRQRSFMQNFQ